MSVLIRALVAVALIAPLLSAQMPAGQAQPSQGTRHPMADPINVESVPSYVRRTPSSDPIINRIMDEGMNRSQAMTLAQQLLDPIGHRMTGSPESEAAMDWALKTYAGWGCLRARSVTAPGLAGSVV